MVTSATIHNQDIHDERGEQQKILHKGSNDKVNVFITLLYPMNGIKFTTSKTRNSQDFKNHLNSIKRYVLKRSIKRFILVIDNASFHVTIVEIVSNKKLSYNWRYKDIPEFPETTVVWELEEVEPNKTRVQVTHIGFTGE